MQPTFESARLLMERAYSHVREFDTCSSAYFGGGNPGEFFTEYDADADKTLHKWHLIHEPPRIMSAIAFDAINCMRSSLDHAVFDSAVILGGKPNPKYTKFPFGQDADGAANDLPRKRAEVPESIRPFLLGFKPYKPENGGDELLWGFNEIRNNKIHRVLQAFAASGHGTGTSNFIAPTGGATIMSHWDSLKNEYTYLVTNGRDETQYDFALTINIGFGESTPFFQQPAITVLQSFFQKCSRIITGIEAETARLRPP